VPHVNYLSAFRHRPRPRTVAHQGRRVDLHGPRRLQHSIPASRLRSCKNFSDTFPEARRRRDHGAHRDGAEAFVGREEEHRRGRRRGHSRAPAPHAGRPTSTHRPGPRRSRVSDGVPSHRRRHRPARQRQRHVDSNAWIDGRVADGCTTSKGDGAQLCADRDHRLASGSRVPITIDCKERQHGVHADQLPPSFARQTRRRRGTVGGAMTTISDPPPTSRARGHTFFRIIEKGSKASRWRALLRTCGEGRI